MATLEIQYGTDVALTVTNLQSLATSSTRLAGWTSGTIDNRTEKAVDYLISGEFKVHASVAPTDFTSILVLAYAIHRENSGTPVWPDLFSSGTEGTEGAATVTDSEERINGMVPLWEGMIDTSTGAVHVMPPRSIAAAFGGHVPQRFALFVVHNTGQNLQSSGNALYATPIKYTVV